MDKIFEVDVLESKELSGYVIRVICAQPAQKFNYHAGQYVQFIVGKNPTRPFSIANNVDEKIIEFHIRHLPDNIYTQELLDQIQTQKKIFFTGPYGELRYQNYPKYPLLFIAAGTGLAPCKAIIEKALTDPNHPEIYLYWTVRKKADLYWHEELIKWTQKTPKFKYTPVISIENRIDNIALKNHTDFKQLHVYVGGPEEMVKDIQQKLSYPAYFYSDWVE